MVTTVAAASSPSAGSSLTTSPSAPGSPSLSPASESVAVTAASRRSSIGAAAEFARPRTAECGGGEGTNDKNHQQQREKWRRKGGEREWRVVF